MDLREQIHHSIPAAIVITIDAWVVICHPTAQWEMMKPVPSWDLAIFFGLAKTCAHFQTPIMPAKDDRYNLLSDHSHLIPTLLGPIWRLSPIPLSLLITQDLLLAFSAWPLTRLASRLTNRWVVGGPGFAYVLSQGMQGAVATQFYKIAFAMPPLAYASVAFVERRWKAMAVWLVPLVLVKEDMGLTVLTIGMAVILTSAIPAWYHTCMVIQPGGRGADGLDAAGDAAGSFVGSAPQDDAACNRRRGLRLDVDIIVSGIAAFLFVIQMFLPAFSVNGVRDYGLSLQDQPTSPDTLTQKVMVVVMSVPISGIVGVTPLWLLVVLLTLARRFLGSVEFYRVWDNWHYNAILMPIVLGALFDAVARRWVCGPYMADHPIRQVGVDSQAVMERSAQVALAAEEAEETGAAGESDVDGPYRRPTVLPTRLTVPAWYRFVMTMSILTTVAAGVLTALYLPLWQAANKNFDPLAAEAKQSDGTKRTGTHRVTIACEVIATIPEGATVVTDLPLLVYLVPRAGASWASTSDPDREYIAMTLTNANQWDSNSAVAQGKKHSRQRATYTLIYNRDNYQIAKRNG